ncbi:MAG: hypothetical protein GKR95_20505 [Gammaproteobacteria bacterium]|nr:hypothetical protein [Gammaproteobacteria bacterium]
MTTTGDQQRETKPERWTGPMVWDGDYIKQKSDWISYLTKKDLATIWAAIKSTKLSNKPIANLTQLDFPFEDFGQRLLAIRDEILKGRGFGLIRGLPTNQWSHEDLMRAYWGIGAWLGNAVSQNAQGHLLGHVIDQRSILSGETRLYQTRQAQPFHSDSCDVVGLLCLRKAKTGGISSIASSAAIHNNLLEHDLQSLHQLYGIYQCDRYGEIPQGKLPHYPVRVFNRINGQLVCCGMDPDIRSAQRLAEIPPLSAQQSRALDTFQQAARKLSYRMTLELEIFS